MTTGLTITQRDTLGTAALTSAAKLMREVADELELLASNPSQVGMADTQTAARLVRTSWTR